MSELAAGAALRRYRRPENWMLDQLPWWMLEDDFSSRFASLFQVIATTLQEAADQLEHVFDPAVAPPAMVDQLTRWIGVDMVRPGLADRLRRLLVTEMAALTQRQGTKERLVRVLELVTGGLVEVEDTGGVYREGEAPRRPAHARLGVSSADWIGDEALVELVRRELPASVTFELFVADRQLWPPTTTSPEAADVDSMVCPRCGRLYEGWDPEMDADGFCTLCDFPLFWVAGGRGVSGVEPVLSNESDDAAGSDATTTQECVCCGIPVTVAVGSVHAASEFCVRCDRPLFWDSPQYRR
jgi:phage tail-like protein